MRGIAASLALLLACSAGAHELPLLGAGPQPSTPARFQPPGETLPLQAARKIEFDTDQGTWLSLDLSPDGRTLLFDMLGDLWALDAQGGTAHAVTTGMGFDTQPAFAPDGARIAFISDRSGNENLWVARVDGSEPRQISFLDDNTVFVSPAWSHDGRFLYVSRYRPDLQAFELWKYAADGEGEPVPVVRSKAAGDTPHESRVSALGAVESPDGRYLYYARRTGTTFKEDVTLPLWDVRRRDLRDGSEEIVATHHGSAMRPVLSPDGRTLAYAVRSDGETGLRLRNLATGQDRWLVYPIQHDDQEGTASRDLVPRYVFTRDGAALLLAYDRKIHRVDIASLEDRVVPFQAHVALEAGPSLRRQMHDETGPVRARVIQAPVQSPDGTQIAFAALARLYLMPLDGSGAVRRLTRSDDPEFQPAWSRDGRTVTYVTWRARGGGQVWIVPADGSAPPRAIGSVPDSFYSNPVFAPDGRSVLALRSSNYARMHQYMELGLIRQAELVRLPLDGGEPQVIAHGQIGGQPHFTHEANAVYLGFADGLHRVALDGSGDTRVVTVKGPGWYFQEGSALADDVRISPDGKFVLAQIAQQLHLLAMPAGGDMSAAIDLQRPSVPHRKLTSVGADFFAWSEDGRSITWSVGSTFYRRRLDSISLDPPDTEPAGGDRPVPGQNTVEAFQAVVEVPRDVPRGAVVLRGGTAITMHGNAVIADADIVVVDNRIEAVGKRGSVKVPAGAAIRNIAGKYVVPGFVDTHAHWAQVRRGVLDVQNWGFATNLAYGVTSGIDVSSLSIDVFSYQDMIDAGMMPGLRTFSTGPAIFSFNDLRSEQQAIDLLTRYRVHYRTENLKEYRTGNRRQRQWVAMAAAKVGLMPTAEGALDMKLDLNQVIDGFSNEHSLTAYPLGRDVVELFARTRASYTMTLQLSSGSPPGQNYFAARTPPRGDAKAERFFPHFFLEQKWTRKAWYDPGEYRFGRVAEGGAAIQRAGGLLGVGSHSEIEGLGFHWEMQAYAMGGMTPAEVLHAATIGSAETIGRRDELGSLEPGKFADLVILDRNPLERIENTLAISQVMKNGRIYDGATLDELWPRQKKLEPLWFWDDRPPIKTNQGSGR